MKKFLALMLALVMVFSMTAFAEETDESTSAEKVVPAADEGVEMDAPADCPFEGTWVDFVDDGFYLYLPSDWNVVELTDEMTEAGIYLYICNADATQSMQIMWGETEYTTTDELLADLAASYAEAAVITLNDVEFVTYDIADKDCTALVTLDPNYPGFFAFNFCPASDETFAPIAQAIMGSISFYEMEAEDETTAE